MKLCKYSKCKRPRKEGGYCRAHYTQQWRGHVLKPHRDDRPKICIFSDCGRKTFANDLCSAHNLQKHRGKKLVSLKKPCPKEKLLTNIVLCDSTQCWNWQGYTTHDGYGRISVKQKNHLVHRLMYEIEIGPIANKLVIDHLCENKSCCNPSHLEAVTQKENVRRHFTTK